MRPFKGEAGSLVAWHDFTREEIDPFSLTDKVPRLLKEGRKKHCLCPLTRHLVQTTGKYAGAIRQISNILNDVFKAININSENFLVT